MRIGPVRNFIWMLLVFLCVFSFTLNLVVISSDQVGDVYDSMHLERTGRLLAHAVKGETGAWPAFRGAAAASSYPTLIHYITLPVRLIAGDHPRAGAVTVAAWGLLILLGVFGIGNLLGGDRAGLLAAFFVACMPGIYRFSRLETTDLPLAAMVTFSLYLLLRSDGLGHRGLSLLFGAIAGLGMVTKQSFLIYIALPAAYLVAQQLWSDKFENRRARLQNLSLAGGLILAPVLIVYLPGLSDWAATRSAVRSFYLNIDQVGFIDNVRLLVAEGFGPLITFLVAAGMIATSRRDLAVRTLYLWLVPPLLIMHVVFGMMSTRYFLPLLPAGAVFAALGIERLLADGPVRRRLAVTILAMISVAGYMAHDNLRADRAAFTFDSFEQRMHLVGVPRPARLGWTVTPAVAELASQAAGKRTVMLLDSPYTSLVQGGLWLQDPRFQVDNLFERAAAGRIPAEFAPDSALRDYFSAADFILIKSGFNTDPRNFNYARDVAPKFAQRVFKAFFEVKSGFELIDSFAYPQLPSPVLLYQRKTEPGVVTATLPDQSPPAPAAP
jgi:4-amino-4-deoxy-L-arabinose transferase-like glycosyltransferase